MAINDKTRKLLWGSSGNLCVFCRRRLIEDGTEKDEESVVGDECHIVSESAMGPRHDPLFPSGKFDHISNLMLFCRVHHKMVDDQVETYTASLLRQLKQNHEKWVETTLTVEAAPRPRIRRIKENIPKRLTIITSGRELLSALSHCDSMRHRHPDGLSHQEVNVVSGFFQLISDYMDVGADLQAGEYVRDCKYLDDQIEELAGCGMFAFMAIEKQRLEGGVGSPLDWFLIHVAIIRSADLGKNEDPDHSWSSDE